MNKLLGAMVVAAALMPCAARAQDDGPWGFRLRALYLSPANNSDAYAPLAIPSDAIHINGKWLPDINFEYSFTPRWSAELVLTLPQTQTVTVEKSALGGPAVLGTFKHLPPVLTAKYHFAPEATVQPYVGAGVNLTLIYDANLTVPTVGPLSLNSSSIGPAVQVGTDIRLAPHWYANVDAKWAMLRSDVKFAGTKISQARIDPVLLGFGVGYRFGL